MTVQLQAHHQHDGNQDDPQYGEFLGRVHNRFLSNVASFPHVFATDSTGLWAAYLDSFSSIDRQHHNCHACRHFIERFGGLVTIDESGRTESAIWNTDDAPELYKGAVAALARLARRAKVTGVFLSSDRTWGTPKTGQWVHLAVTPPKAMVHKDRVLTAFQASAAKTQDHQTVSRALSEITVDQLDQAVTLLKSDALYRSEKVLGQAEWLHALKVAAHKGHGEIRKNIVWRAIATAPAGFCHPRSSMIGTLLDDIVAGMDFAQVSRRFSDKMNPLQYQRPQAAPTTGAIEAAEKLVEKLGIAPSLERRYARLDEVVALWKPTVAVPKGSSGGVFGHLKDATPATPSMTLPTQTMTWDKFRRTVLDTATRIEVLTPRGSGPFTSFTTAVHMDAPPILQWDNEGARNPVGWYFWMNGATASQFGLPANEYVEVTAVTLKPNEWLGGYGHHGQAVAFLIAGAKDSKAAGMALFPEMLKSELHGVRSVIEAHSKSKSLAGKDEQSAAGLMFNGKDFDIRLRVWVGNKSSTYRLDRMD